MESDIIIVSGLPRSGTSLMMQMLDQGGVPIVTDNVRTADSENPRGYFEWEKVKKIKQDVSWLPETRGKAFKMVSQLLYDLPASERYRILFMERNLEEMLASQERMLKSLGRSTAPREQMKKSFLLHLDKLHDWLGKQTHIQVLRVSYNKLVEGPEEGAEKVSAFLDGLPNVEQMAKAVDVALYRNRMTGKV
jgi:hypothetical protein